MTATDRDRWNAKYAATGDARWNPPDDWLLKHAQQQPIGNAMDLACGLGHNAIWLAQQGWQVEAVDISAVGLALAAKLAMNVGASDVTWIAADLDAFEPQPTSYDLIAVFRFLDRQRLPRLIECALKPGGLLVYETFSQGQLSRRDNHLKNPQFALQPGELPLLFPNLTVVGHEELDLPERSVARFAARKPLGTTASSSREIGVGVQPLG